MNLFVAIESGDGTQVDKLIMEGADVNKSNWAGWTPLFVGFSA
jgi:ankyrin repeat protein